MRESEVFRVKESDMAMVRRMGVRMCLLVCAEIALSACSGGKLRELTGCVPISLPGPVYDMAAPGGDAGVVLVSVQDPNRVDAQGEWINDGGIFLVHRKTHETVRPAIVGRDDYPFKPQGIDAIGDKVGVLVYVVNAAFREQRSLELFRLEKSMLVFQRRSRLYRLKHIVDASAWGPDDVLLLSRDGGAFAGFPQLLRYRNRLYGSLPGDLGRVERFGGSADGISLLPIPDRREILEIWGAGNMRLLMGTERVPVATERSQGRVLVLGRQGDSSAPGVLSLVDGGAPGGSASPEEFSVPVIQPEAMLVLHPEKRVLIAGDALRGGRLIACDEP